MDEADVLVREQAFVLSKVIRGLTTFKTTLDKNHVEIRGVVVRFIMAH